MPAEAPLGDINLGMHVVRAYERMHQRMLRQANDNDSRFVDDPAMVMAVMASQGQDLFSMTIKAENDVVVVLLSIFHKVRERK